MTKKIVCFSPFAIEIICGLGLESSLVGRSLECDFPESVKHLPVVDAISIHKIDERLLKQLAPHIIFTGDQRNKDAEWIKYLAAAKIDADKDVHIISLQSESLDDIYNEITIIARELDVTGTGSRLIEDLQERVDIIRHKLKYVESKPTVACLKSLQPLKIAGNRIPELVGTAGGSAVSAQHDEKAIDADWDNIRLLNPDVLLLMPYGFSIEHTLKAIDLLIMLPGFAELNAVKNKGVYIADGSQYFYRPGPRIVDSIEMLAEIIHPKQFSFGYEGEGWIKFDL